MCHNGPRSGSSQPCSQIHFVHLEKTLLIMKYGRIAVCVNTQLCVHCTKLPYQNLSELVIVITELEIKQSESSVIFTSGLTIFDKELPNKNDILHYSEPADTTLSENTKYRILQRKE